MTYIIKFINNNLSEHNYLKMSEQPQQPKDFLSSIEAKNKQLQEKEQVPSFPPFTTSFLIAKQFPRRRRIRLDRLRRG